MTNQINEVSRRELEKLGFNQDQINTINLVPELVNQINQFHTGNPLNPFDGGHFVRGEAGAGYIVGTGNIEINPDNNNYIKIKTIAHELGHALGKQQDVIYNQGATKFAESMVKSEGDAVLNEYNIIQNAIETNGSNLRIGMSNTQHLDIKGDSLYNRIHSMKQAGMDEGAIRKFICQEYGDYGEFSTSDTGLNYFENYIWQYFDMIDKGLKSSYFEVTGEQLNWDNHSKQITGMIKNHLYGELESDNLNASVKGLSEGALIYGDKGKDILIGSTFDDIILGGSENDQIDGKDGFDKLSGDSGDDEIHGGSGNDVIYGGTGGDALYGEGDNDTLFLATALKDDNLYNLEIYAHDDLSTNYAKGGEGNDTIYGSDGTDVVYTGTAIRTSDEGSTNTVYGFKGNDEIVGAAGIDILYGGQDNDLLEGGKGQDKLHGGEGEDVLDGGADEDELFGDENNDILNGGYGKDILHGGNGNDTLYGGHSITQGHDNNAQNELYGEDGNDTLYGSGRLEGGKDFDTYFAYDTAIIKDEDGQGKVHIELNGSPTLLTGGTHKLGADDNTYESTDGKITYIWDKQAKTLKINDNLTIEDWENGQLGIKLTTGHDIAFVIDVSNSMDDDMRAVVNEASRITNALFNINDTSKDNRIAIATYETNTSILQTFTNQDTVAGKVAAFDQAVSSLPSMVNGGTENIFHALYDVLKGKVGEWREDATSRTIFVIGDEPGDDTDLAAQVFALAKDIGATANINTSARSMNMMNVASYDVTFADNMQIKSPLNVTIKAISINNPAKFGYNIDYIASANNAKSYHAQGASDIVDVIVQAITDISLQENNLLLGTDGKDTLYGKGGQDELHGGKGEDILDGGSDNDKLFGEADDDQLDGGDGDDILEGNGGNDKLKGGDGNDNLQGGEGNDKLQGGEGNDTLEGNEGNDNLNGDVGADKLLGGNGDDTLDGGEGDDVLQGNDGDDKLTDISGTTDQLTIKDFFLGGENAGATINFASGGSLTSEQIFGAYGLTNPSPSTNTATDYQSSLSTMLNLMSDYNKLSPLANESTVL
ncbi:MULTISPECIES: VWA domain-containing protein [unclassified Moraxella]|uniref:VWA domain-containing protein n=1 Tax=unclassified Moraxella TaxID=2685852 RepID=UPI003AF7AB07